VRGSRVFNVKLIVYLHFLENPDRLINFANDFTGVCYDLTY